jgi:mannose-6-phosphate isomerase-like protein (cupin superfamily)
VDEAAPPGAVLVRRYIRVVIRETPYGTVEVLSEGEDVTVWRIRKDGEEVDPTLARADREDVLVVVEGALRLELEGREPVVLEAGEAYVIPAGTPFRGYRWPRDGAPCEFVAVAPSGTTFS